MFYRCFTQEVRQVEYLARLNCQLSCREISPQVDKPATYSELQKTPLCKVPVEAIQISQRYWNGSPSTSRALSPSAVWPDQWYKNWLPTSLFWKDIAIELQNDVRAGKSLLPAMVFFFMYLSYRMESLFVHVLPANTVAKQVHRRGC